MSGKKKQEKKGTKQRDIRGGGNRLFDVALIILDVLHRICISFETFPLLISFFFFHHFFVNLNFLICLFDWYERKQGKKNPFETLNNSIESGGGDRWRIHSGTALIQNVQSQNKTNKQKSYANIRSKIIVFKASKE